MLLRNTTRAPLAGIAFAHALLFVLACTAACDAGPRDDRGVAECDAYAAEMRRCFSNDALPARRAADQASALQSADDAERARMRAACSRELARLKSSCR